MSTEAASTRALASRLAASMLARVRDGTPDGGWLHDAARRELRKAAAAGLDGVDATVAVAAVLLGEQARAVHEALMHHAAALDARAGAGEAQTGG